MKMVCSCSNHTIQDLPGKGTSRVNIEIVLGVWSTGSLFVTQQVAAAIATHPRVFATAELVDLQ